MEYETDIFLAGRPGSNPADYGFARASPPLELPLMDPNLDAYMLSYTTSAENEGQPSNNHDANQVDSLIPSGFQGNPSPPEFINHQQNGLLHNPRRSPKSPKNQLGLEGELDLSRPDSINQQSIQVAKTPRIRPRHNLSLEGHLDFLSRPDSINRQQLAMERNPKRGKVQPTDNFGLEGHLELSRPHSINQQIHSIQRSPKMKPKDHLGPLEGLDISWPSSPNILKFKKGPKMVKPRDNFCLEGQMEISRKEWGLFDVHSKGQHLKKRPFQDTLEFTTKDLQRCELESRNQDGRNKVATRKPKDTISLPSATGMEYQRRTNIYEAYDGTSRPLRIKPKDTLLLEGPREWPSSSFKSQAIASSPVSEKMSLSSEDEDRSKAHDMMTSISPKELSEPQKTTKNRRSKLKKKSQLRSIVHAKMNNGSRTAAAAQSVPKDDFGAKPVWYHSPKKEKGRK